MPGGDHARQELHHTRRPAKWIFELCAKQPEGAALVNLSHKTVEWLYYQMACEQINLPQRYAQVRKVGIDEVAHRKGKRGFGRAKPCSTH